MLQASRLLASGLNKIIFQLPTGGGKTVCFSAIANRYIQKSGKSVLIVVHREELLNQARKTLFNSCGIVAQPIVAGMRTVPPASVYIGMIESTVKRIDRIYNVGMVIIDEAHRADFFKIHEHFQSHYIIGFTATPLSANKKKPLKDYFQDIVCCVDIPELIQQGALCQNITYAPEDVVDRSAIQITGGDFNEKSMGDAFKKPRYIENTVLAYEKFANRTKAVIFNVNISHSLQVMSAFKARGHNVRHLDGSATREERRRILNWLHTEDDAVLCSCELLTAGFDEPTLETIIVNRATLSMPLWLQMTGRGSRPTPAKSMFNIIDLGMNWLSHGDWSMERNWRQIFLNPPKPKEGGVAPIKACVECDALIHASCTVCQYCGAVQPIKERPQETPIEQFKVVTKGIDVTQIIEQNKHRKEYYPFFEIGNTLAKEAKKSIPHMDDLTAAQVLDRYHELAKEWCQNVKKRYNQWHKERAQEHLYNELAKRYKTWQIPK